VRAPRAPFEKTGDINMTQTAQSPALTASQSSWRCAQAHDREGWLALMTDDVVIEDPIGKSVTNRDGTGVRGKEAAGAFFDKSIGRNQLRITCEETFPSSSPDEIAHILVLNSKFEGGLTSEVRGVFTYRVNDAGLITNLRGYWNLDVMKFGKEE
jgi:steroid Delta-isomerase